MIRAQVVGATGYGGLGIVELILRHPQIEIASLLAKSDVVARIRETIASAALLQAAAVVGTMNGLRGRWNVWPQPSGQGEA